MKLKIDGGEVEVADDEILKAAKKLAEKPAQKFIPGELLVVWDCESYEGSVAVKYDRQFQDGIKSNRNVFWEHARRLNWLERMYACRPDDSIGGVVQPEGSIQYIAKGGVAVKTLNGWGCEEWCADEASLVFHVPAGDMSGVDWKETLRMWG